MKFEDTNYSFKENMADFYNKYSHFISQLTKYNMEFFSKMYGKTPASFASYINGLNSVIGPYKQTIGHKAEKAPKGPDILPANGHDIYNYVSRYGLANCQIQAVLKIDGYLDFDKLCRAVNLSIDSQPVFGCRFVESDPPYWKRLENIKDVEFCSMEYAENPEEAVKDFVESPLDINHNQMLKVKLIRTKDFDTLCLKTSHACCDGAGTKEYIELLSEIYSIIDRDFGIFIPIPSKRGRNDQDRLFKVMGIPDPELEWIPGSEISNATWPFHWEQVKYDKFHILFSRLPEGHLAKIKNYSKARGATVNDLFLTAYYRAMAGISTPVYSEPMEISVTADLRRYLPDHKTEAIRNFSGSEQTRLYLMPDESFEDTLLRVVDMMKAIKNNRPGLQSAIGLERIEKLPFSETLAYYEMVAQWPYTSGNKCAPVLSNLGLISGSLLKFGKRTAVDAYIVPPVVSVPGLLLMVSTYNNIITLACGYYEQTVREETIEAVLNGVRDEIITACSSV